MVYISTNIYMDLVCMVCMVCSSREHFMNTSDEYFAQNCTMCKNQFNVCIWLSGELDCIVLPRTSKPGQCFQILHFANVQISPLPSDCTNHCGCLTYIEMFVTYSPPGTPLTHGMSFLTIVSHPGSSSVIIELSEVKN